MRRNKSIKPSPRPRKGVGVSKIGSNTNTDNRLTHAQLMLGYMFEWGVDFQRRVINLTGDVDDSMYDILDVALTAMEAESKSTVTIKINSLGGDTYAAMAIVGRIRESTCYIVTKGYGAIMSAATLILAAGRRRMMSKFGWFMWHEASYDPGYDRHSNHKALIQQQEKEEKYWAKYMAEFTSKNEKFWAENGVVKDAYFSAAQLLKMGVVDELF